MTSQEKKPLTTRGDGSTEGQATFSRRSSRRGDSAVGLLLAVIAVFYTATIRDGNFWPDDYALYIHHAINIAEGRAYAATGYIYNRAVPDYSPRAYPPVFPLLLAPIYRAFGLNLHAMKAEEVFFFVLSLIAITAYCRRDLRWPYRLALVGILGFNPNVWSLKDSVVADIPFLLFFYLAALVAAHPWGHEVRRPYVWAAGAGVLLYLCVGTRTVGLSVVVGWVIYGIVKRRKVTGVALTAIAVCAGLMLVQRGIFGAGEQSYADQLHPTLTSMLANLREYSRDFVMLWAQPWGRTLSIVTFAMTACLAGFGLCRHMEKGLTTIEAFLIPYLFAVWVWPSPQGLRFLLPVIPFYIFLMLLGLQELVRRARQVPIRAVAAIPLLFIALSYAAFFRTANYGLIHQTDGRPSFNELCKFIRTRTDPADVFIFRRSRALSLFTSRPAAVYDLSDPNQVSHELDDFHAAYVVTSPIFEEDRKVLIPFVESFSSRLKKVYENSDFQLYRVCAHATDTSAKPDLPVAEGCPPE